MFSFVKQFAGRSNRLHTVIIMDAEQLEPPHQFQIHPHNFLLWAGGTVFGLALMIVLIVLFTPVRDIIPGYDTSEMQQSARLNALRLASLQDSLAVQQQYMRQLRHLVTGEVDSAMIEGVSQPESPAMPNSSRSDASIGTRSSDWEDHLQPALPMVRLAADTRTGAQDPGAAERYIATLKLPVLPPLSGFLTRGFDARTGHFAVDIAVEEGTVVRSIGDGYVIFADWTQEGGDAIAVQHAGGYISLYKHNQRLLKRVGDRVRDREAIAVSGNSGEITSGPHLHFELWRNGLAQDPRYYVIGW